MIWFEPGSSGFSSDHSGNCATTIAPRLQLFDNMSRWWLQANDFSLKNKKIASSQAVVVVKWSAHFSFYSYNPSSNPTDAYSFSVKFLPQLLQTSRGQAPFATAELHALGRGTQTESTHVKEDCICDRAAKSQKVELFRSFPKSVQ